MNSKQNLDKLSNKATKDSTKLLKKSNKLLKEAEELLSEVEEINKKKIIPENKNIKKNSR